MAPVVSKSSSSSTGLNETDLCSKLGLYGAANVDKISSRFGWDHKTVIWEIMHMSVAVGRPHTNPFIGYVLDIADQEPSEPHEYKAMLDIDYMNSLSFDAGDHDQNRSNWGLSVYKTSGEFLGLFLHLYDIEGESGTNRRSHHNHSFDDYQGNGIYFKYNFSVLASDGTVVRKIGKN